MDRIIDIMIVVVFVVIVVAVAIVVVIVALWFCGYDCGNCACCYLWK